MKPSPKSLSLKQLGVPEVRKEQALSLLQTHNVSFAMILYDGSGSIFWLTQEDPKTAEAADRLLVLHASCRSMIEVGADWIWGDLLVNKLVPNGTIGYVLDDNEEIELAFYDKLGPKSRAAFARRLGSIRTPLKAEAARENGAKGGRPKKMFEYYYCDSCAASEKRCAEEKPTATWSPVSNSDEPCGMQILSGKRVIYPEACRKQATQIYTCRTPHFCKTAV